MWPYFTEYFGNPSSLHSFGQEAKAAIEKSRSNVAALIGATSDEIVFTSGGTESDNFAIKGVAYANRSRGNHIITSVIEHHAVIEPLRLLENQGFEITRLPVDEHGILDPQKVQEAITDKTILISVMHANNEIGTIEPLAEIAKIAKEKGVYVHSDAVQSAGRIPVDVDELMVDLLSMSAHKLYGPKGVGALYIRKGTKIMPFMHGGEQEHGRRASTENVPGIVGFGKAAELIQGEMAEEGLRLTLLRDRLIEGLMERIDDVRLNGHPSYRLPNNINISVRYVEGESMILNLDLEGIAASTSAACSSISLEPSHVLLSLGLSREQAHCCLRFSLGKWTCDKDIERVLDVLPRIVSRLRAVSPLLKGKP